MNTFTTKDSHKQDYLGTPCCEADFFECSKFNGDSKICNKEPAKRLRFFFWIIIFEVVAVISPCCSSYFFYIKLLFLLSRVYTHRHFLFNSVWLKMMKKCVEIAFLQISAVFGTYQQISETGTFICLSKYLFQSQ